MELQVVDTGFFKLDGGAMFGVVPKTLWGKQHASDEYNRCTWAMRCLLIRHDDRLILIDTGCGNKQDEKFFSHYHLSGNTTLLQSLHQLNVRPEDITDVFLTHLHFDHVGGAVSYDTTRTKLLPTFPKATYWSNEEHWQLALSPNPREKASFLQENFLPLEENGQLSFISTTSPKLYDTMEILFVSGHTQHMMLPLIQYRDKKILYVADLVPSVAHIPLPWIASYDVQPLVAMDEKARILQKAADEGYILFFEHDPEIEAATVIQTDKGIRANKTGKLTDFI